MEKTGTIEIRIDGQNGTLKLTPESFDIRELKDLLGRVEDLLFPGERKDRPTIGYRNEEGSVKNIFTTSMQTVIAFNAVLGQVRQQQASTSWRCARFSDRSHSGRSDQRLGVHLVHRTAGCR
ncbi:MAG: hypothetical protein IPH53_19070 [Flavobacteriales bacterium]|nr:hypothetical protein [Flavobacteriales bacterium]